MKRAICIISALILSLIPLLAYGEDAPATTPVLTKIEFKNADIVEEFSPYKYDYTLSLNDTTVTPTLKNYEVSGEANIFVTYSYDNAKHQTGALVTLEYENGSSIYSFAYRNAEFYEKSDNNYLKEIGCNLGVVSPEINRETTDYTIYIPSDLTVLDLSAATEDIGAYCEVPTEISLSAEQELDIPVIVTASNGEKRTYSFSVVRTEITGVEFATLISEGRTQELVKSERFYQQPAFLITVLAVAGGLLIILLLVKIAKRLTIEVSDADETEFFDKT